MFEVQPENTPGEYLLLINMSLFKQIHVCRYMT